MGTDSLTFEWNVQADTEPTFSSATSAPAKTWAPNQAITGFTMPAATGGNAPLSYSATGLSMSTTIRQISGTATGLPSGVSMSSSRRVSGTPGNSGARTAIVTATDTDGDSASIHFAWAVSPGPGDLARTFGASTVAA